MRTRTSAEGGTEGYCRHCSTWKLLDSDVSFGLSRNPVGDLFWYWNGARGEYKPMCKACEAERKRQRRAAGTPSRVGRGFGVEMELTGPSAEIVIDALIAAGIRMDRRNVTTREYIGYASTSATQSGWALKRDGSVRGYGLELVSPVLHGEAGLQDVVTVCAALNACGATVDISTGLHVHHDFRNMAVEQVRRQALMFVERQDLIAELVAPSRRGNHYCDSWNSRNIAALRAATNLREMQYIGPRGNINLGAYARHGSVEIRFHGGSTNARKVCAWIRFGQALFAAGEAEANISTTTPEAMLADLQAFGLTSQDVATLLRFRRFGTSAAEIRTAAEAVSTEVNELVNELLGDSATAQRRGGYARQSVTWSPVSTSPAPLAMAF